VAETTRALVVVLPDVAVCSREVVDAPLLSGLEGFCAPDERS
jgi:hypothetical protein